MKRYHIVFAHDAVRDFELILSFSIDSYVSFGESLSAAVDRAALRLEQIRGDIRSLATMPHRGTRHDDVIPGVRHLAFGKAVVWFDIDDDAAQVTILAVFYGGQDHVRHMPRRLLA